MQPSNAAGGEDDASSDDDRLRLPSSSPLEFPSSPEPSGANPHGGGHAGLDDEPLYFPSSPDSPKPKASPRRGDDASSSDEIRLPSSPEPEASTSRKRARDETDWETELSNELDEFALRSSRGGNTIDSHRALAQAIFKRVTNQLRDARASRRPPPLKVILANMRPQPHPDMAHHRRRLHLRAGEAVRYSYSSPNDPAGSAQAGSSASASAVSATQPQPRAPEAGSGSGRAASPQPSQQKTSPPRSPALRAQPSPGTRESASSVADQPMAPPSVSAPAPPQDATSTIADGASGTNVPVLPDDVLRLVFSMCEVADLAALSRASRHLRALVQTDDALWLAHIHAALAQNRVPRAGVHSLYTLGKRRRIARFLGRAPRKRTRRPVLDDDEDDDYSPEPSDIDYPSDENSDREGLDGLWDARTKHGVPKVLQSLPFYNEVSVVPAPDPHGSQRSGVDLDGFAVPVPAQTIVKRKPRDAKATATAGAGAGSGSASARIATPSAYEVYTRFVRHLAPAVLGLHADVHGGTPIGQPRVYLGFFTMNYIREVRGPAEDVSGDVITQSVSIEPAFVLAEVQVKNSSLHFPRSAEQNEDILSFDAPPAPEGGVPVGAEFFAPEIIDDPETGAALASFTQAGWQIAELLGPMYSLSECIAWTWSDHATDAPPAPKVHEALKGKHPERTYPPEYTVRPLPSDEWPEPFSGGSWADSNLRCEIEARAANWDDEEVGMDDFCPYESAKAVRMPLTAATLGERLPRGSDNIQGVTDEHLAWVLRTALARSGVVERLDLVACGAKEQAKLLHLQPCDHLPRWRGPARVQSPSRPIRYIHEPPPAHLDPGTFEFDFDCLNGFYVATYGPHGIETLHIRTRILDASDFEEPTQAEKDSPFYSSDLVAAAKAAKNRALDPSAIRPGVRMIEALKITGDPNVPAGQVTWRAFVLPPEAAPAPAPVMGPVSAAASAQHEQRLREYAGVPWAAPPEHRREHAPWPFSPYGRSCEGMCRVAADGFSKPGWTPATVHISSADEIRVNWLQSTACCKRMWNF